MDIDSVIPALKAAAEAVSQKGKSDPYDLMLLVQKATNGPEKAEPIIKQLLRELRQIECLQIFENTMQVIGHSATKFDITNLATWLLRRSLEGGRADGAVADLKRYLESKEISVQQFVALTGFTVDQKCDLGNGIFLIPWDQLPHDYLRGEIYKRFFDIPFKLPSSAICKEMTITQIQVPSEQLEGKMNRFDDLELRDALFCACLVGPLAPEILVSGYLPPAWAPISTLGMAYSFLEGLPQHGIWTGKYSEVAKQLVEEFQLLKKKDLLRLAMQRLNLAMRRISPVDRAIDLGIVLESLFLNDLDGDRGELSFRLRVRASRYLEDSLEERSKTFKLVGDLYTLRSKAVHTGKMPPARGGVKNSELLQKGFDLAAATIKRFILEGIPDWNNVILK